MPVCDQVENVTAFKDDLPVNGGFYVGEKYIFSDLEQPFDSWSNESLLRRINITVFEAVVGPGETLYVPPGHLHGAQTLDHSLMFATNDGTLTSMAESLGSYFQVYMRASEN